MVISILGIVAAFTVPTFISIEKNARTSTIKGVGSALRSASSLAHALWLTKGSSGGAVTMEGTSIVMAFGYASIAGIQNAVNLAGIYGARS